jgi:hypothetical protein
MDSGEVWKWRRILTASGVLMVFIGKYERGRHLSDAASAEGVGAR